MKKIRILGAVIFLIGVLSCTDDSICGTHEGKQLYEGPEGGCYYINSNDNKTYVDRSECNC